MDDDVAAYLRDEIDLDELIRRNDAAIERLQTQRPYDTSNWVVASAIEGFIAERVYQYVGEQEFRDCLRNLCFPDAA